MGTIFISHSSRDNAAAGVLRDWLVAEGHQAIFLDHHSADGLVGGVPWEEQLYTELRRCRALIALVGPNWLDSPWCVAEADHAQALRKPVLPLLLGPIEPGFFSAKAPPVLRRTQAIDWQHGVGDAEACSRVRRALLAAGLDPKDLFLWRGDRSPYPGLAAFQRDDAAVYFGREQEITDLLAALRECRAPGRPRLVLVQGASGTGKSSLLRAGVLPRLERDPTNWIVVPPFRPLQAPLNNLAETFGAAGIESPPPNRVGTLPQPAEWVAWLQQASNVLRRRAANPEATVLVSVDQLEEVLGRTGDPANEHFLLVLREVLAASDHRLLVVATLRADFTGTLQRHPALRDPADASGEILATRAFQLGPMPRAAFNAVIEGPALLAGLELEPGLVSRLVAEAQTDDALPLLAFVLRELWDRFGAKDLRLTHAECDSLGGLEEAVGDRAEKLVATIAPSPEELSAFRDLLVFGLAEMTAEGRILRRRLNRGDVAAPARRLLEEFAQARLIVADETAYEVAHEALFRRWPFIREAIESARDSLAVRRRVEEAYSAWRSEPTDRASRLLPAGRPLEEAKALLDQPGGLIDPEVRRFVEMSAAASADARRKERRRRILSLAGLAGTAMLAAASFGLFKLWTWTDRQRALTETARERMIAANAERELDAGREDVALAVALEGVAPTTAENSAGDENAVRRLAAWIHGDVGHPRRADPMAVDALRRVLRTLHGRYQFAGHAAPTIAAAVSGDGLTLLTGDEEGRVALWNLASGAAIPPPGGHTGPVLAAALDSAGNLAATAALDGTLQVWDRAEGRGLPTPDHPAPILDIEYLPKRRLLATAALDGRVRIWDPLRPESVRVVPIAEGSAVLTVAVSPDESVLAAGALDGSVTVLAVDSNAAPRQWNDLHGAVRSVMFSTDGSMLVAGSNDRTAMLWELPSGRKLGTLQGHEDWVLDAQLSGGEVLTASLDGTARTWNVSDRREVCRFTAHQDIVSGAVFADGRIVTASHDGILRIWSAGTCRLVTQLQGDSGPITRLLVTPDGRSAVTLGANGSVRVWSVKSLAEADHSLVPDEASAVALVGTARRLAHYRLSCDQRKAYLAETDRCTDPESRRTPRRFSDPRFFLEALSIVLKFEGSSCSRVVSEDPDGQMCWGIDQRTYDEWRKRRDEPQRSVTELTPGEMREFYRAEWWTRAGCDDLQPSMAMLHFDTAVNVGRNRAVVFIQQNLGLPADGILGPMTRSIVSERGLRNVELRYLSSRVAYYQQLADSNPRMRLFLPHWLRRSADLARAIGLPEEALPKELQGSAKR